MYVYIDISHKTCRSLHCTQTYLLKLHYESLCRSLSLIAYLSSLFIHLYTENVESIRIRTHTTIQMKFRCQVDVLSFNCLFVRLFARSWSTFWFTLHCFSNGFIHILPSITFALSHFSSFIYASMHLCVHSQIHLSPLLSSSPLSFALILCKMKINFAKKRASSLIGGKGAKRRRGQ